MSVRSTAAPQHPRSRSPRPQPSAAGVARRHRRSSSAPTASRWPTGRSTCSRRARPSRRAARPRGRSARHVSAASASKTRPMTAPTTTARGRRRRRRRRRRWRRQGEGDGESRNARRRRRRRNKNRTGEVPRRRRASRAPRPARAQRSSERGDRPDRGGAAAIASKVATRSASSRCRSRGYLDLRDEGYGFLRVNGYLPSRDDAYIPVKLTRQFGLRKGDHVTGLSRPAGRNEKNPALLEIHTVNDGDPELAREPSPVRGPHRAVPRREAGAVDGQRPAQHDGAHHRPRRADRQGSARHHRLAAEGRQDHDHEGRSPPRSNATTRRSS